MSFDSWNQPSSSSSRSRSTSTPSPPAPTTFDPATEDTSSKKLKNCSCCRYRRIKCVRKEGSTDCVQCIKRGIVCQPMPVVTEKRTRNRSGKRIEDAKLMFGLSKEGPPLPAVGRKLPPETSPALVPSSLSSRLNASLLQNDVAASVIDAYLSNNIGCKSGAVSGTDFKDSFSKAGRRLDALDDPSRVLASVVLTVAARFSAHPALVGSEAPTMEQLTESSHVGVNLGSYGAQREAICESLLEQALEMLDAKGTLRKPSLESVAALFLLDGLFPSREYGDPTARVYAMAHVCHAKILSDDSAPSAIQKRVLGSVLGWTAFIRDSLGAATGGTSPLYSEDDIAVLRDSAISLEDVQNPDLILSVTIERRNPDAVIGFWQLVVAHMIFVSMLGREVAKRLTGVIARRAKLVDRSFVQHFIDSIKLCKVARIESTERAKTVPVDDPAHPEFHRPFKPNMVLHGHFMSEATLIFVVCRTVELRVEGKFELARQSIKGEGVDPFHSSAEEQEYWNGLRKQSQELRALAFQASRDLATVIRETIEEDGPISVAQFQEGPDSLLIFSRLSDWLPYLLREPVMEEGGLINSWTYNTKIEELTWILNGVYAIGWAYPSLGKHSTWLESEIQSSRARQQVFYSSILPQSSTGTGTTPAAQSSNGHQIHTNGGYSLMTGSGMIPPDFFYPDFGVNQSEMQAIQQATDNAAWLF